MEHDRAGKQEEVQINERVGRISRRMLVSGMVATPIILATLPLTNSAYAQVGEPMTDMMAFILLSEALTGISRTTLAPELSGSDPGVDPINIKDAYFEWIKTHSAPAAFGKLLLIAKSEPASSDSVIGKVTVSDDDTKFLARSIVLLWYLGSWYDPKDLKANAEPGRRRAIQSTVVSAKAYTQGLVWLIAGAHPMGYSNLQFGYWSRDPHDPNGAGGNPVPLFDGPKS